MNRLILFALLFPFRIQVFCQDAWQDHDSLVNQDPQQVISAIRKAQASLYTLSYVLERTDTLVTGDTRVMRGHAEIRVDTNDSLFGFEFCAKREGTKGESIYDGRIVYETDDEQKTYSLITNPSFIPHVLGQSGGQVLFPDLVRLETAGIIGRSSWRGEQGIYLRFQFPDLTEYDVIRRSKTFLIDRKTMLPMAMRNHQETAGKVQDLYYRITEIHINEKALARDWPALAFLKEYRQLVSRPDKTLSNLMGKTAPAFVLRSFDSVQVSLSDWSGKPVLLDFWEVWCGPCVESMPKIQRLYDEYRGRGLKVCGIINDIRQLEPAKIMAQKKEIHYPMLIGDDQLKKDYAIRGVPLYILIDGKGYIRWLEEGYSEELDKAVRKLIEE